MKLEGFDAALRRIVHDGSFLRLRKLKLSLLGEGGERTREGTWEFVERPMGLDAVVLALWSRGPRVLLRYGVRVPLHFGRPEKPAQLGFAEVVAGIVERGEEHGRR